MPGILSWRRTRLAALGLLLGAAAASAFATAPFAPGNLLVDDVANPVGTEAVPYFGWLDNDTNANEIQSGYEILVASSAANLNANIADIWDSGQVASSRENHVVFSGATTLTADTPYFWKVRTWDREGIAGPYSTNASFTVGLLANSDWDGASWIVGGTSAADIYTYYRKWTAPLSATSVQRATVYITSVHKYALYVNGALVGKGPAYAFPQYQLYNAYDISGLVTPGTTNLFAIFNHWFGGGSGRAASSPGVLMKAVIHYTDGTSANIGTDGTWLQSQATNWATGQSLRNSEGAGYIEKIYAGSLTTNWFTTGFNPTGWTAPTVYAGGQTNNSTWPGPLLPDLTRIVETVLAPVSVTQIGGNYVADLGRIHAGLPLITFSGGTPGTVVNMAGGFELLPSGDVSPTNDETTIMTDFAVLNGSPFTFHPVEWDQMRYFEITNPPMPITTNNFSFVQRNSQMNDASSSFSSPNANLNAVWGLMKQTLPLDAQEEFVDSMRQKGGFLGDGFQQSLAAMEVEDERPLTRRRLNEFLESMAEFWATPAANVGRVNACYPDDENSRDIPDFTQMFLDWVWEYYMQTGDIGFLGANYTQLTNIAQYVNRDLNPATGLITNLLGGTMNGAINTTYEYGVIDNPTDMYFGYDLNTVRGSGPTSATVINGWAWVDYDVVSRIAGELGNTADSNTYRALAANLQAAINTNLINSGGLYVDGLDAGSAPSTHTSQHANAFPLSLNLVPLAQQAGVAALVVRSNMSVSALGIIQVVRGLGEANQGPGLLNLFTNASNYGWARILSLGGTATWESWTANTDGDSMAHGWGAVGLDGYVRYILGVKPLTPQFGQVQIMPLDFTNLLPSASGTLTTDRGALSVEWDRSAALYHLAVTIPVNVTANVYVPQGGLAGTTVYVDGATVTGTLTNLASTANGYLGVFGLGSGAHNIQRVLESTPPASLTAIPGNTQISLYWPPSLGTTSYVILRGTSSGNETTTVASDVTTTNYTDTGLVSGDTYFYVVVANGPTGPSADSPEAFTTTVLGRAATWTDANNTTDNNWSDALNWTPGVPQKPGDAAIFPSGSGLPSPVTLDVPETVGGIIFNNSASYTISGADPLTLDNKGNGAIITVAAGAANMIQPAISLNDTLETWVGGGESLTLAGNIGNGAKGEQTLTVGGSGVTILSGANTYGPVAGTVGTTLGGGGTLQLGNNSALGGGDLNATDGTLQVGVSGLTLNNNIKLGTGTTTVDNNGGLNSAWNGVISGGGALAAANSAGMGTGTLVLGGANNYTGATTIAAGAVVSISADSGLGAAPASATPNSIVLNGGGLLGSGAVALNANRGVGIGATTGSSAGTGLMDAATGATLTVNGVIASAGNTGANNLAVNTQSGSAGTVILGAANTITGATIVNAGTLQLNNPVALSNSVINLNGGALAFGNQITTSTNLGLNGSGNAALVNNNGHGVALTLVGAGPGTYSGNLTDSGAGGSLVTTNSGALTLSGNSSLTGGIPVSCYSWPLQPGPPTIVSANGGVFVQNGTLLISGGTFNSPGVASFGVNTFLAGVLPLGLFKMTGGAATFGLVTNADGQNGDLISIAGNSTFNATEVDFYRSGNAGSVVTSAGAPLPIDSPALADGIIVNGPNAVANVGTLLLGIGNTGASMMVTNGATVTITNKFQVGGMSPLTTNPRFSVLQVAGGSLTVLDTNYGMVVGQNGVTNSSPPTYAPTSDQVYLSGGVTTAGIINFGLASDQAGGGNAFLIVSNATLYVGGGGIVKSNTCSPPLTNTIALNAGALLGAKAAWSDTPATPIELFAAATVANPANIQTADASGNPHDITLGGAIWGRGALEVTGGGILKLTSPTNSFGGGISNSAASTLVIGGAGQLGGGAYAGNITNNGVLSYSSSAAQTNLGVISGTGALNQNGSGALTLSASNTYSGGTTVNAGTLALIGAGSIAGSTNLILASGATLDVSAAAGFTVGAAQTLSGTGAVNGAVTLDG
ncbi:MAG: autotransporter-associated beta strand repeat-containing protein, partial [Verrucomicrobiota bacterium]